jgi:anthranilate synthase
VQRTSYDTEGGIRIHREVAVLPYSPADTALADRLDHRRGVLFSSSFEFPGRYTRWDMGFVDPPLALTARGRSFSVEALNERGRLLLGAIGDRLGGLEAADIRRTDEDRIEGEVRESETRFPEEQRSRQPSVFSVLRALGDLFASPKDEHLGLYGAFGYDLVFQFEPMQLRLPRPADQRDLVLYLPDEILIVDHMRQQSAVYRYDFVVAGRSTAGLPRATAEAPYRRDPAGAARPRASDHAKGEYAKLVERAKGSFIRGDLFEVVCAQLFAEGCADPPSVVFQRLREANPAPYGSLVNLGDGEFLVSASPEMYVRVEKTKDGGRRIETCPICGTIRRGADALEDAERIRELLNSAKDESELTMCTDVDRNDKSRVCVAGSVKVIGRRQIEIYSRLIHTVDHVEGILRPEFDALDGFLSHAWAVTVTGAPKLWAIRFIEEEERSSRRWYGGAIGRLTFDGNMNTGLTLRTIRMQDGVAETRVGATLLYDSDPVAEEDETELKAAALFSAIGGPAARAPRAAPARAAAAARGRRVLLIDHEDSFVHTLAGYVRTTGADVATLRHDFARAQLRDFPPPDLVVLSPGPGRPDDFAMRETLDLLTRRRIPVFGVCLGLQGIVEYFGGALGVLDVPMHGKPSLVRALPSRLLRGLPERFIVGRYHSLHAVRARLPAVLAIAAHTETDGVIMAVEHVSLPIAAVQFHPESVMTSPGEIGMPIIESAPAMLCEPAAAASS